MISVTHAVGFFFPDSTGGTEVYVDGLARNLEKLGHASTIVAPSPDLSSASYSWGGLSVERYPWGYAGNGPHVGFEGFLALLDRARPDVYHQHSWTGGCGHHHLRAAKERGLRTVTTVHLSGNVCLSGTMMRMRRSPCDGRIDERDCSACWATSLKGIPATIAVPMARLSRAAANNGSALLGGLARLTAAFDGHREAFDQMVRNSDRIVAVCQWLYDALLLNGVPREKLVLCRQGVDDAQAASRRKPPRVAGSALRVGFLGRYDPIKGLHVLVEAFRRLPAAMPIELHVYGVANGPVEAEYAARIRNAAGGDPRILFPPPVSREAVGDVQAGFDVLAVPSQVFETGPLVVMESLAAGTPVLGSDLGGIAEQVDQGSNGWLVAHDVVDGWTAALARLCNGRESVPAPNGGGPVRSMREVARETAALYRQLV